MWAARGGQEGAGAGCDTVGPMANWRLQGRTLTRRLAALGRVPLWLPVVVAPLMAGTAERPYTLVLAGLCGLAGLWAAARAYGRRERLHGSWFAVALLVAALATLLQCVPLPPGLRALLAPGSEATLRELWTQLGGEPARALPLSVDPSATGNEGVRLLGYLSLLLALGAALRRRGDRRRLGRVIYGSASLVAALGGLTALGVALPAFCAVPADGATRALLPAAFYNSNHLAALLAVGTVVTVGAVGDAASRSQRVFLGLLLALQELALLATLSRAGIVIGLGGQLVVLMSGRWASGRSAGFCGSLLGALLVAGLVVVASPTWFSALRERFFALSATELLTEGGKLHAWRDALPLLRGHWAFGVGRGAFEDAFASYHRLGGATRFVYLENEALQALIDWGVPLGLGLGALLGLGLRDAARGLGWRPRPAPTAVSGDDSGAGGGAASHRSGVRRAALVALVGLMIHNTVDFSLEVGGVAVAALALLALIEQPRFTVRPVWGVALAVATLLGAATVWRFCPSHDEDGARLHALAISPACPPAEVVAVGTQAARRHPLDSYLYATVAARLWHAQLPEALGWVNRALLANPRDLGARRTSALILTQYGHREQALRTLALALPDANRAQRWWIYHTALALAPTPAELLRLLPTAADWLPADLTPGLFADELLELFGESAGLPWPLVRAVAEWGRAHQATTALPWLGRCVLAQRDATAAGELIAALKSAGGPPLLLADLLTLLIEAGRLDEAELVSRTVLSDLGATAVLLSRALLLDRRGQLDAARALLDTAQTTAEDRALRSRVHEARAELETRAGNLHRAQLERVAAAAELHP